MTKQYPKKPIPTNTPKDQYPRNSDKYELLLEILGEVEGQCIIWCNYIATVKKLTFCLKELKYDVYPYTGEMSDQVRTDTIEKFRGSKEGVLIATIPSAGKGLNLQTCSTMIFYEFSLVPSVNEQAQDRCHRIGQTNSVTIYYLYGKDTVEEHLISLLKAKKNLQDILVSNKNYTPGEIKRLVDQSKL